LGRLSEKNLATASSREAPDPIKAVWVRTSRSNLRVPACRRDVSYPLLLSSLAGLSGNVALTCTGAPANSTCIVAPSIAPLGGTSTISVSVETGVAVAALAAPARPFNPAAISAKTLLLALLLPVALVTRRRRYPRLALVFALTCALSVLSGCGTSRVIPASTGPGGSTPTPDGAYTLTVAASSAGLTHSVNLTLVVQ
jgi:hypothetical protein